MHKFKLVLLIASVITLSGCSDSYDKQATEEAKRGRQTQYTSLTECQKQFSQPNDCYRGTNGSWFSPIWYPWGAVMHNNGAVSYNNAVPSTSSPGTRWVNNTKAGSVDFGKSNSYVATRASSMRAMSTGSSTSRGGFGSTSRGFSSGG